MTPFMGVRISWLIMDTNSDFVFDATSTASRAANRSSDAWRASVTSNPFSTYPLTDGSARRLDAVQAMVRHSPLACCMRTSNVAASSASPVRSSTWSRTTWESSGWTIS